jgi:hypothetical protein
MRINTAVDRCMHACIAATTRSVTAAAAPPRRPPAAPPASCRSARAAPPRHHLSVCFHPQDFSCDKNRWDIGKSESKWTAAKMETPGTPELSTGGHPTVRAHRSRCSAAAAACTSAERALSRAESGTPSPCSRTARGLAPRLASHSCPRAFPLRYFTRQEHAADRQIPVKTDAASNVETPAHMAKVHRVIPNIQTIADSVPICDVRGKRSVTGVRQRPQEIAFNGAEAHYDVGSGPGFVGRRPCVLIRQCIDSHSRKLGSNRVRDVIDGAQHRCCW